MPKQSSSSISQISLAVGVIAIIIAIVAIVLIFVIKPATGAQGPPGKDGTNGKNANETNVALFPINQFTIVAGSIPGVPNVPSTRTYIYLPGQTISGVNEFAIGSLVGTGNTKLTYTGPGGRYMVNMCVDISTGTAQVDWQQSRIYYNSVILHTLTLVLNAIDTTYNATFMLNLKTNDTISADLYISYNGSVSSTNTAQSNYILLTKL